MLQKNKKLKIVSIVLLVLLVNSSINAAVVSDNDGASFITKAEFDSAKNSFQATINDFNTSIDDKISNAISAYIAGAKQSKQTDVKQMDNYNTIRWMHGPYMYFTNRKFTAYNTVGAYTDNVGWQILKPENRRQADWDPYTWSWDYVRNSYDIYCVSFMLNVSGGVTKQWGDNYNQPKGSGPTIYFECEKIDGNWVLTDNTWIIRGERGYNNYIAATMHYVSAQSYPWGWSNADNLVNAINNTMVVSDVSNSNDILGYKFTNIPLSTGNKGTFESHITKKNYPNFPPVIVADCLWESVYALKTGCGQHVSASMRVDNGLIEDNRWKTQSQITKDNENFRYSMFGANVDESIKVNVAPKMKNSSQGYYVDLSESGESTSYKVKMSSINLTNVVPWNTKTNHTTWMYGNPSNTVEFTMTIPLFYRLKYSELRNRVHKSTTGEYLSKGDGYPVLLKADKKGNLQLKIKYEEKANVDTTVVTSITPDNKIKTYFKNKRWSDTTGTFYQGYTNLKGTGTKVSLNGTEWTSKEITVNIPVKEGEDVWMRIDPLTSNGIYCLMTDIQATYVTE